MLFIVLRIIIIFVFFALTRGAGAHTLTACEQSVKCRKNPSPPYMVDGAHLAV